MEKVWQKVMCSFTLLRLSQAQRISCLRRVNNIRYQRNFSVLLSLRRRLNFNIGKHFNIRLVFPINLFINGQFKRYGVVMYNYVHTVIHCWLVAILGKLRGSLTT